MSLNGVLSNQFALSLRNILGKPDPPEDFQAQNVTSDRVLVSWSHGFDGGSPQFFRIRYMVKGSEEISNVDVLPTNATVFMITGLEPGTEYSFALMAWNVYGESGYTENEVVAQTTEKARWPKMTLRNPAVRGGKPNSEPILQVKIAHQTNEMDNVLQNLQSAVESYPWPVEP
ncbi:nephrin [Caerostris darwini]|uniref:Nephrin n=1 Tax=Caerostris darwini TaxID=1538125 RepID=A0AAV4T657_9ARAC|nr:nephrin [Caerostris darwini]